MNPSLKPLRNKRSKGEATSVITADFYKHVLESLADYCIFTTDKKGFITSWNKGGQKIFGYSGKEIIGKNISMFFTLFDRRKKLPQKKLNAAYKKGQASDEYSHIKKDKTVFWGKGIVVPLRDDKKKWIGFTHIIQDLTERKIQEFELKNERNKLTEIFDRLPAFLAVLKGKEHIYELVNKAYEQLINHRKIIGISVKEALPEVKEQGFINLLDKVYKTGQPFIGKEIRILLQKKPHAPLEERYLDFTYQAYRDIAGKIKGVVAHGYDVTDKVTTRKKIEESEAALKASEIRLRELFDELKLEKNKLVEVFEKATSFMVILRGKYHVFEMVNK